MDDLFKIGDWLIEPKLNRLTRDKQVHTLEPRLMRLLLLLAEADGEVVDKDALFEGVWNGLAVTDESLAQAISKLRKTLGVRDGARPYIETIRKRGYRMCQPVEPVAERKKRHRAPLAIAAAFLVSVLILGVLANHTWRAADQLASQFTTSTPLTTRLGRERDPSLSNDGRYLVYSAEDNTGRQQVFLHGVGSGSSDRVLTQRDENYAPIFLNNNETILMMRKSAEACSVIMLSVIDGSERAVSNCTGNKYPDITLSPAGDKIAFSAKISTDHANRIVVFDLHTGLKTNVTEPPHEIWGDYDPAFSEDGTQLFFARSVSEAMQDLYVVDLQNGAETRLTFDGRNIMGLAVFGPHVRFASNRDGRYGIWQISHDGLGLLRLPIADSGIINPTADGSGTTLAFEQVSRVSSLNIAHEVSLNKRLFTFNGEVLHPAVSPNGNMIAYSSNQSGFYEIWTADNEGQFRQKLTDFRAGFTAHPRFSPDARQIAFDARPNGLAALFVMSSDGEGMRQVSRPDKVNRYAPTWTSDGKNLVFTKPTNGRLELWLLDLSTGIETQLTYTGGSFGYLLGDGRLFFTAPNTPGIWELGSSQSEPILRLDSIEFSDWGNWVVEGNIIRYFDRQRSQINSLDLSSGNVTPGPNIAGYVPTADPAVGFFPSSQHAAVVIREKLESDVLMSNKSPPPR